MQTIDLSAISHKDSVWIAETANKFNEDLEFNAPPLEIASAVYSSLIPNMPSELIDKCAKTIAFSSAVFSGLCERENDENFPEYIRTKLEAAVSDLSNEEKITFAALMMTAEESFIRGECREDFYKQILADVQVKQTNQSLDDIFEEMISKIINNPNSAILLSIIGEKQLSQIMESIETGEIKPYIDENLVIPLQSVREREITSVVIHAGLLNGNLTSISGTTDYSNECGIINDAACISTGIESAIAICSQQSGGVTPTRLEKVAKCIETVFGFVIKTIAIIGGVGFFAILAIAPFIFLSAICPSIVCVMLAAGSIYLFGQYMIKKGPDKITGATLDVVKGMLSGVRRAFSFIRQKFFGCVDTNAMMNQSHHQLIQ